MLRATMSHNTRVEEKLVDIDDVTNYVVEDPYQQPSGSRNSGGSALFTSPTAKILARQQRELHPETVHFSVPDPDDNYVPSKAY